MRVVYVERRRGCGCGCGTILALLIGIGLICSALGIGQKPRRAERPASQEQTVDQTPVVDKETHYEVTRVDVRRGILGNTVALDGGSEQYAGWGATMLPDGTLSFDINGVAYTTKATKGEKVEHTYSGQTQKITQLLLDGKTSQMVGSVEVEAYAVDGSLLIDLTGQEDGKRTRHTFYLMPPLE